MVCCWRKLINKKKADVLRRVSTWKRTKIGLSSDDLFRKTSRPTKKLVSRHYAAALPVTIDPNLIVKKRWSTTLVTVELSPRPIIPRYYLYISG